MASEENTSDSANKKTTVQQQQQQQDETDRKLESERNRKLESFVTPEQVLSANAARKRRNITAAKKRSQSGGRTAREQTPVRELRPEIEFEKIETKKTIKPPVRKRSKSADKYKLLDDGETVIRKKSEDLSLSLDKEKENELLSLISKAKKSAVQEKRKFKHEKESVAKRSQSTPRSQNGFDAVESDTKIDTKNKDEKKILIKRSQSTPRPQTEIEDNDLIESFKKAQRLSAELGTSNVKVDYNSSDTTVSSSTSIDDEETLVQVNETIDKQQTIETKDESKTIEPIKKEGSRKVFRVFLKDCWRNWKLFVIENEDEYRIIKNERSRCINDLIIIMIFCGIGGLIFRWVEGAFESFYKCGVKRIKRDFIDSLWLSSHHMREDDWKSLARRRLRDFEEQLHVAHEAGLHTYSGQRSWSFLNGVVYCFTVVTQIGYGHISPATDTGRAITIVYAIIGIPLFLILLADFGKLFTRCIKFVWAFVRRIYYTGSCRNVRRTEAVQEVMKGVHMVYEIATFRRPSQTTMDVEGGEPRQAPLASQQTTPGDGVSPTRSHMSSNIGDETPITPAPSNFAIDDEFNLPITVAIAIFIIYILCGATMYSFWEEWSFFESFYFVFISMSTIGFGDFVPEHPIFMMCSIIYLVFGLALTSMCINVVQVKLSDTFRQASAKIGATIGLTKVAEETGSVMSAPIQFPKSTDIEEVQLSIQKSKESLNK